MSHVAKVELEIKDLESLAKACSALGLEFVANQESFKWYGRWVNDYSAADAAYRNGIDVKDYGKCQHAIRVAGNARAYEVGVVRAADGKWSLVYDNWQGGSGLEAVAGKGLGKLKQQYGAEVAKKVMVRKGFAVSEKWENGRLQVSCVKR